MKQIKMLDESVEEVLDKEDGLWMITSLGRVYVWTPEAGYIMTEDTESGGLLIYFKDCNRRCFTKAEARDIMERQLAWEATLPEDSLSRANSAKGKAPLNYVSFGEYGRIM